MIRLIAQLTVGVLLSGCTVNAYRNDKPKTDYNFTKHETIVVTTPPKLEELHPLSKEPVQIIHGNKRLRPDCEVYVPLKIPKPPKINLEELANNKTTIGINAIILQNNKAMYTMMLNYGMRQEKHHAEYVKRCVVK